jgi:cell division protein FtsZ
LYSAVAGIAEIINSPGMINVDFADVKTVMSEMGMAMIGSGFAEGSDRAIIAAKAAVACPLLEDVNLNNAKGILVNISASRDFKMKEYFEVMEIIKQYAAENANIIVGNVIDDAMANSIRVTMVATGLTNQSGLENEPADVMKSFVYETEDKSEEHDDETVSENTNEDLLNVFADNSENDIDAMKAQADDEYDIPSFLRKK